MYFYARRQPQNQAGKNPEYLWVDMPKMNDVLAGTRKPTEAYKFIEDRTKTMRWASEQALSMILEYLDIDEGFLMEEVPIKDLIPKQSVN